MTHQWQPEAVVDEMLARDLVRRQFPSLAAESVELVAAGWDYTVHRVDGEWAFRFPRRAVVLEPMARELDVLTHLPRDLPIPVPEHLGRPSEVYAWPFWGARWLPGAESSSATEADRHQLAPQLGTFLRRLHATELPSLPVDVVRRADMAFRVPRAREEVASLAPLWSTPPVVEELLDEAEQLPPSETMVTCHGDLHFRQVIADGGRLTGVVDWVDVCRSDPGIDLQLVFAFLPPAARPAFFAAYGAVSHASLLRARVLAVFLSAMLARYGRAQALPAVETEALASLDRATADL